MCMLAYGVVFVLLIGEIDLSIAFVSGIAGVVRRPAPAADRGAPPGLVCIFLALLHDDAIGAFQGSFVAFLGVPSFVVTLAGFLIWQGVILRTITQGVIVIQDNTINNVYGYFFSDTAGWIMGDRHQRRVRGGTLGAALSGRRHGIPIRDPLLFVVKLVFIPPITLLTVGTATRTGAFRSPCCSWSACC